MGNIPPVNTARHVLIKPSIEFAENCSSSATLRVTGKKYVAALENWSEIVAVSINSK